MKRDAKTFEPSKSATTSCWMLWLVIFSSFVIRHSSSAEPLAIELVSEVTAIQPGTPFSVGLHLKHREHYHTYWKFPGIVGVPTGMEWELPSGWEAGPIAWPAPQRVMMFQIKAQGYHDEVLLPMQLIPPKDLEPGTKITLKGKATWMCCGRDCNPGFADLSITLPVEQATPTPDERWQKMFTQARANLPQPLIGYEATARRAGDRVTLKLTPSASAARKAAATPEGIFFTDDGYINPNVEQVFRAEGDALVVELPVSTYFTEKPPAKLEGVLWLKDGSFGKGVVISAPFAK